MDNPVTQSTARARIGARAFVGTFGTNFFIQVSTTIQGIILARLLTQEMRGLYAAIILWPTVLSYIGLLGTNIASGRLAAKEDDVGAVFRSALSLAVGTSIVTAAVGYVLLGMLIPQDKQQILPLARLFMLYVPACQLATNLAAIDQGSGNFFRLNFVRALRSPLFIVALVAIWVSGVAGLFWFVAGLLAAHGLVTVIRLVLLVRQYGLVGRLCPLLKLIRKGLPFGFVEVCVQLYQYADRILLLWLLPPEYLGLYAIGLAASSVVRTVGSSVAMVSFTISARDSAAQGFERVAAIFRKAVLVKIVLGAALALAMPVIIPVVLGSRWVDAVPVATVLVGGSALSGLAMLLDQCMRGQGNPFAGLLGRILAIITMVAMGYLAIKVLGLGAVGMAVAFTAGQLVYLCVLAFWLLVHYRDSRASDLVPVRADIASLVELAKISLQKLRTRKGIGR